ncbi:hypothetical protein CYMTET_23828 [Cymbomonas tetramitiformis]|uniref:Uncharacterized protein n=1 Tax=Cymbomonas tetramitiformis TaxID=36881 RepID=A0AAE0L0J1_9CHLO|nr:hypothetical protein CYMTET_23828 [Cymbomonas tetramitiformis]
MSDLLTEASDSPTLSTGPSAALVTDANSAAPPHIDVGSDNEDDSPGGSWLDFPRLWIVISIVLVLAICCFAILTQYDQLCYTMDGAMHYIMDKVEEVINGGDGSREEAESNDVENVAIPMAMPATTFNTSNGQPILMLSSPVYIMETDPTATNFSTSPHHPPLGATQVASVSAIQLVKAGECLEGGTEEPDWKELFLSTINQILGELSHELHELKYAVIISRNLANEAQDALTNLLERTYGAIKEMKNAAVENNGRERKEAVTKAFSEVKPSDP